MGTNAVLCGEERFALLRDAILSVVDAGYEKSRSLAEFLFLKLSDHGGGAARSCWPSVDGSVCLSVAASLLAKCAATPQLGVE